MKLRRNVKTFVIAVLLLILWCAAARSGIWSAYVLPSPGKVAKALYELTASGVLFVHVGVSLKRVVIGFVIAFVLAFFLGVVTYRFPRAEEYYGGILEFFRNVPPISLIALLILWFGIGETSKIIIIVLASFFPVYLNICKGFISSSRKLLEVGEVFGFPKWKSFLRIVLPCSVPDILVGMRIGLGYSFRAIIGAEMIAAASGMGYLILDAQRMSRSDKVIAGILVIGLVGILVDKLFGLLTSMVLRRMGGSENLTA